MCVVKGQDAVTERTDLLCLVLICAASAHECVGHIRKLWMNRSFSRSGGAVAFARDVVRPVHTACVAKIRKSCLVLEKLRDRLMSTHTCVCGVDDTACVSISRHTHGTHH